MKSEVKEAEEQVVSEKAVVLYRGDVEGEGTNPLARYQSSRAVRLVTDRVMALDTVGLNQVQGTLVAQCALANKLNPFPPRPEIHYWLSEGWDAIRKKKVVKLNIQEAREATIRNAEMNAKREGTYLHAPRFEHIQDETQKEQLGFLPSDMVCLAKVSDNRQVKEYYDSRAVYQNEGMNFEEIDKRLGIEPDSYEGYGSLNQKEKADCQKGKFSAVNKVQKRAYTEALKQKWARLLDYDELIEGAPVSDDDYVIDSEWQMVDVSEFEEINGDDLVDRAKKGAETLYGPDEDQTTRMKHQWEQNVIERIVDLGLVDNKPQVTATLNHSIFFTDVPYGDLTEIEGVAYFIAYAKVKEEHPRMKTENRAKKADKVYEKYTDQALEMLGGSSQ